MRRRCFDRGMWLDMDAHDRERVASMRPRCFDRGMAITADDTNDALQMLQ